MFLLKRKFEEFKLANEQYSPWVGFNDLQAGLPLLWCQKLITFTRQELTMNT